MADELGAVMGAPNHLKPYAPALDYHRLVPTYLELLGQPDTPTREVIAGMQLFGYLKLESQRRMLETILARKTSGDGPDLRSVAAAALGQMGAVGSLEAFRTVARDPTAPDGAMAEALLGAPPEKALPILKDLAARSSASAWALIRMAGSEATIVDLLYQPGDESGGARAAYHLIRAYHERWNDLPAPPNAAVLAAIRDKVQAVSTGGSLISEYGRKVLKLAKEPLVVRNPWQQLESALALLAAEDQPARQRLLLVMHFRNNKAPAAFLASAQDGALVVQRVMVEGNSAWAHVADKEGQTHYTLFLSKLGGSTWVIEAATATSENQIERWRNGFLRGHPKAADVKPDEPPQLDPVEEMARAKQPVAEVAAKIMKAIGENDLQALQSLSAGSAMGWLSPQETKDFPAAMVAGWSADLLAQKVKEIHQAYAARPELMQELWGPELKGDWAALSVTSPKGKIADPELILILQRIQGDWRLADITAAQGPLAEQLEKRAAGLASLRNELLNARDIQARERAIHTRPASSQPLTRPDADGAR